MDENDWEIARQVDRERRAEDEAVEEVRWYDMMHTTCIGCAAYIHTMLLCTYIQLKGYLHHLQLECGMTEETIQTSNGTVMYI
jgi:hypothetical protein